MYVEYCWVVLNTYIYVSVSILHSVCLEFARRVGHLQRQGACRVVNVNIHMYCYKYVQLIHAHIHTEYILVYITYSLCDLFLKTVSPVKHYLFLLHILNQLSWRFSTLLEI